MTNFRELTKEIFDNYTELTQKPEVDLVSEFDPKFYEKYNLPALHLEDGFSKGDATHEEIAELDENLVTFEDVSDDDEPDYEYDFSELDRLYVKELAEFFLEYKKENWVELFKEMIKDFLNENYPEDEVNPGVNYSVWLDIEDQEVSERTDASSNWGFLDKNKARVEITSVDNYENYFDGANDLIANYDETTISENLEVELPKNWDDMTVSEREEWIEENAEESVKSYNETAREEAIDKIIDFLDNLEIRGDAE